MKRTSNPSTAVVTYLPYPHFPGVFGIIVPLHLPNHIPTSVMVLPPNQNPLLHLDVQWRGVREVAQTGFLRENGNDSTICLRNCWS